jgi:cytochrome P450
MEPITKHNKETISPGKVKQPGAAKAFKFNPFLAEFQRDPYSTYHRLRVEDPIHWSLLGTWVLTRYVDVKVVLRDPRFCSNPIPKQVKERGQYLQQKQKDLKALAQISSKFLFFLKPPDHTRLRGLLSQAFSPNVVERLRPQIQEIVDKLLEKVRDRGFMDIVSDIACPLPIIVTARMLGVPDEAYSQLHEWSNHLSLLLDPLISLEAYEHMNQVAGEFIDYFRDLIAEREKRPKEDLISALITARDRSNKLSEDELVSICMVLFVTSEGTTANLIGNGILALLRHPDQMEKLKREPAIIQIAVEELLRYDSPVQQVVRVATENVEIGGKTIRVGEKILVSLGAANRDPAQFLNPDLLDLTRDKNHHLAFADSIHHCLAAPLARVEGQIAINTLVQRLPKLKLSTDTTLKWKKKIATRGLKALPVTFTL